MTKLFQRGKLAVVCTSAPTEMRLAREADADALRDGLRMKDMQKHLDSLQRDAAECQLISELASDQAKRDLFAKLAQHHRVLAAEVERAIADQIRVGEAS